MRISDWSSDVCSSDLSYFPLSLWSWQDAVKAVFLDRVNIVSQYETVVRSPSFEMRLPSVIALKEYVHQSRSPALTRFNVFLRDRFSCQYCGFRLAAPRSEERRLGKEWVRTCRFVVSVD